MHTKYMHTYIHMCVYTLTITAKSVPVEVVVALQGERNTPNTTFDKLISSCESLFTI